MTPDVILNKTQVIERCLKRIDEEYANNPANLYNYTKQDSIILNLQRACEASIDLAMHLIARHKWDIPQSSRDAFDILHQHGVISASLAKRMKAMVGFRNIAVHDYQALNLNIVQQIITKHLADFRHFSKAVLNSLSDEQK
ncbi:protein of unknown function DUF86 [Caldalkalibacillus thermarum TA2.A1]|uniref:DUF86 domain-containing protein n=1 Tax=Caldalkalibacillus thermarum (strain TA2.A1) TaxID=986075 RepID=F5L4Q3_CALTT|nr:DUF86 domain-containing protein [Caldalkalibacillus thermarum]EGL83686.1 protein of unknown function DUF86 [Caldalkalibacillus thermarum TA2.A1]QZT34063.1 DUF86 domain-containing protein [Caldalkalibacillus thermarum TA2.A1]GGK28876.1 hypothetical protein GCM10010965_22160 [Caldalkalibacillus thermarum]